MPKISVIIPTYNRAKYLKETVQSVLSQSFNDYEIIVIDDGSTDNTKEIIDNFLKENNEKIRYLFKQNGGLVKARNWGILKSRGEYIAFLDDDDLWLPHKLEIQFNLITQNSLTAFVCSECYIINHYSEIIGHDRRHKKDNNNFESLFRRNFVMVLTTLVRKSALISIGLLDETLWAVDDYDCWLRLAKKFDFIYIDIPTARYRIHEKNVSKNTLKLLQNEIKIFKKIDVINNISLFKVSSRISKLHYKIATHFYDSRNYLNSFKHYVKAVYYNPLIGYYVWPQKTSKALSSVPFRIIRIYFLMIKSFLKLIFFRIN